MPKTELLGKKFEKVFVLDTNIILNDANNIELLSQRGDNLIVLPEVVLDELDAKKIGFDEINFQARSFGRLLQDASIIENISHGEMNVIKVELNSGSEIQLHIITKSEYQSDSLNIDRKIVNDRKILEVTKDIRPYYDVENENYIFLSLDIMARTRALSMGINSETLKMDKNIGDAHTIDFSNNIEIDGFEGNIRDIPEQENHISNLEILNPSTGRRYEYFRSANTWDLLDEKNTKRIMSVPRNRGQKVMCELILDETNDIIVVSGPAGTGKNYVSLGAVVKLMDTHKDKYTKIIYIRKTIISGNKDDELGFLPGDLADKMNGYIQPMENSIETLMINKAKKKLNKEELEEAVEKFKLNYDVEYVYGGHLRGQTFPKGSIVILDESQNWDRGTMKTIISRAGEDNKFIIMGSNNQIDTPYLGKANNALTFMMAKCGEPNSSHVKIQGVNLTNVVRSRISEWADIAFENET